MSGPINDRRRSSADRLLGAVAKGFRRVSLTRRGSSDNDLPTQSRVGQSPAHPVAKRPSMDSIPASVRSPSMVSSRSVSSLQAPIAKLNSSSPASELPKTWAEWNYAYANGFIDFDDPPPPPTDLSSSEHATITGQFRAPFPLNEAKRQRAVDNIGSLLFNQGTGQGRRPSLKDPKDPAAPLSPKAAPPVPPPEYQDDGAAPVLGAEKVPPAYPNGVGGTTVSPPAPLNSEKATKRQDAPIHPALEKLAQEAKEKFGVSATTVSLMDRDEQVFLSDSSCTFLRENDTIPRELTCCSHAMLKASTGTKDPLVILDFAKDWRFAQNGFGDYKKGFYAAAPIMLPAPMGDDAGSYPGGIFCLLGEQPRTKFSEEERLELQDMADKASVEIQKFAQEQRKTRKVELGKKRQEWKKSKLVRRVSGQPGLDTVVELPTPPMTPDMGDLDLGFGEDQAEDDLVAQADLEPPRRPSLAESIGSDGSATDLQTTAAAPVFGQRSGAVGVLARKAEGIPADVQSVLDLSTQLVAESIEMDFAFLVALDIPAAQKWTPANSSSTKSPIRLISVHGMPIPPPLFSVESHLEPLVGETKSLLFTNDKFDGADGDFSTGLLCKIAQHGDTGYLLGCFSEDGRRVLNGEDLMFLRSFSRDLSKYTADL